jgi:hypothetical protein
MMHLATKWHRGILLSERSQTEKSTHWMFPNALYSVKDKTMKKGKIING